MGADLRLKFQPLSFLGSLFFLEDLGEKGIDMGIQLRPTPAGHLRLDLLRFGYDGSGHIITLSYHERKLRDPLLPLEEYI